MPNKKLLIVLGVAVLALFLAIILRSNQEEVEVPEENFEEMRSEVNDYEISEEEREEMEEMFLRLESDFYNIAGDIFLLENEVVEQLEGDIVAIENKIDELEKKLENEVIVLEEIEEDFDTVQQMIAQLAEKLTEVEM